MLTRACCCGGGGGGNKPCSCVPGAYTPANPSQAFSYTVDFPGYTGKVRLNGAVSNVNIRLGGLPGVNNSGQPGVPFGGLYCYTNKGGCPDLDADCIGCGGIYSVCGNPIDPVTQQFTLTGADNLVIEEHAVEITDFPCGVELSPYSGVRVNFVLTPTPSFCSSHVSRICFQGDCIPHGQCAAGCPCTPTALDEQEGECVTPTFWIKGNECGCWPWLINAVAVDAGLVVTDPNPTAATMTANWDGSSGSVFTFTSNNADVRIEGYTHRVATSSQCSGGAVCTTKPLADAQRIYTNCDVPTDCCCQSELTVRVRVVQTYQPLGLTSYSTAGTVGPVQSVQNIFFARYRSCDDEKLYDNALLGRPVREFKLHKVRCTALASVLPPHVYRPEWSILSGFVPTQACELTLQYPNLFGSTAPWAPATYEGVQDPDCACSRDGVDFEVNAVIGEKIGFPPTLFLNRVTP